MDLRVVILTHQKQILSIMGVAQLHHQTLVTLGLQLMLALWQVRAELMNQHGEILLI